MLFHDWFRPALYSAGIGVPTAATAYRALVTYADLRMWAGLEYMPA
jgi:hypothetical protein